MQTILIITVSLHVLVGVFWAGSTFALSRTGAAGAEQLAVPQMGAAAVAVVTGAVLWHFFQNGPFGTSGQVLAVGIACALVAGGIQGFFGMRTLRRLGRAEPAEAGRLRGRVVVAQRAAAALLLVTVICMAAARYV
jgi:hypothetical protein